MNKKTAVFLAVILALVFSGCKKDEKVVKETKTETTTTEEGGETEGETGGETEEKEATLFVTFTGRDSYENLGVTVRENPETNILLMNFQPVNAEGKVSIDVKKYIGKDLFVMAYEDKGDSKPDIKEASQSIKIQEGDNALTLELPAPKVYGAKITVLNDGKPVPWKRVYAINPLSSPLLNLVSIQGSKIFKDQLFAVTATEGWTEFKDLDVTLGTKYHFVVVTQEPNLPSVEGAYKEVVLDLDGTEQTGTIELSKRGSIRMNFKSYENLANLRAELYDNADLSGTPKYTEYVKSGEKFAHFPAVKPGRYYMYVVKNSSCLYSPTNGYYVEVKDGESISTEIEVKEGVKLKLKCASSNPYEVTVRDNDGNQNVYEVAGKTTKTIRLAPGKAYIHIKQISGYVFTATEEDFAPEISCGSIRTICFPSDKCN